MSKQIVWDPRKMISKPFLPCPSCGHVDFGTVSISNGFLTRRCRACLYSASERLPPPRLRRVVYLDQFVISNMAKTLDPVWRAERGAQPDIWMRVFDALDRAMKLHLIVCPGSSIHEHESAVHPHFGIMQRLYEHLAAGTRFEYPTQIHGGQLCLALRAKLSGVAPDFSGLPREAAIRGALADWLERLSIKINMGPSIDTTTLRSGRNRSGDAFEKLFEKWAREKLSFDAVYQRERSGLAEATLELLRTHVALRRQVELGLAELTEELWNYRLEVGVALDLVRIAEESGLSGEDAFKFAVEFLFSEEALSAPMNEISTLLVAGIAHRAATGQKRPPSRGMWNDITAISAFLPFCDAMFVDNECAQLLSERPIASRLPATTRMFSTRTAEGFVVYLRSLEAEAGVDWVQQVLAIYGGDWATPFRTILEQTRESNLRKKDRDPTSPQ